MEIHRNSLAKNQNGVAMLLTVIIISSAALILAFDLASYHPDSQAL